MVNRKIDAVGMCEIRKARLGGTGERLSHLVDTVYMKFGHSGSRAFREISSLLFVNWMRGGELLCPLVFQRSPYSKPGPSGNDGENLSMAKGDAQ